jgi:hypothetical protein
MMMYTIKNSILSKCLQVLLMGYFLLSSINITNSFKDLVSTETASYKTENSLGLILKKIFKCTGCTEELDDYETKAGSTKNLLVSDYIIPGHSWLLTHHSFTKLKSRLYAAESNITCSFYCKINVPPPDFF